MIKTKTRIKYLEYFFAIMAILQCNTVFFTMPTTGRMIQIVWYVTLVILFGYSAAYMVVNEINILPLIKFLLCLILILVIFSSVQYQRYSPSILKIVMDAINIIALTCFFYVRNWSGEIRGFFYRFENIVVILSGVSLFFWFLSVIGVPTTSQVTIDWGGVRSIPGYFWFHFLAQGQIGFLGLSEIPRNTGLFAEAPMYSYILCLAMLIDVFLRNKEKLFSRSFVILVITIFTTTSTTGVIVLLGTVVYYVLFIKKGISKAIKLILAFVIVPVGLVLLRYILISKFDIVGWNTSTGLRIDDIHAGFLAWKDGLWFGNGLGNIQSIIAYMDPRRIAGNLTGISNGMFATLATGGITFSLFYIVPSVAIRAVSKEELGMGLLMLVLLFFTVIPESGITFAIICYFWVRILMFHLSR